MIDWIFKNRIFVETWQHYKFDRRFQGTFCKATVNVTEADDLGGWVHQPVAHFAAPRAGDDREEV